MGEVNKNATKLLIAVVCLSLLVSIAPAVAQRNWEQFHYDVANTGYTTSKAPETNQTKWVTGNIGAIEGSQPIVADGKVFIYANDTVYALSLDDGSIIWSTSITGDTSGFGSWASPAYADGMLFVSNGYHLTKLDADTGAVLEDITFPDGGHSCNGGPTVADGMVFAGSGYGGTPCPHYYAFNMHNLSEVIWSYNCSYLSWEPAGSTPAVSGDWVVFGEGSNVTCVNKSTGAVRWRTKLSGTIYGSAAIDSAHNRVYIATGSGSLSLLYALNFTDGSIIWTSTPIDFTDGTPTIWGDYVYISGNNWGSQGHTYCFYAENGSLKWSVPCGSWVMSPTVADGKLFTGNCDDMGGWGMFEGICAYDAVTGAQIWSYPYGGSSPAVVEDANGNGIVVSIGKNGKVYAFADPDLAVTWKSEEWISIENRTYSVTYTIKNIGAGPASPSTASISIDGVEVATDSVPALKAGESYTNTVGPFTMSGDEDVIKVCADKEDVVRERNEANNCLENVLKAPPEVPAITPLGFALTMLSLLGLAAVAMNTMKMRKQ